MTGTQATSPELFQHRAPPGLPHTTSMAFPHSHRQNSARSEDVIHTVPVACALRDQFPDAYLAWAVGPSAGTLLQGHPALDEIISVPRNWLKSPRSILQFRRHLRSRRFDTVIDVQCLTKSAILGWISGAPRRIGYGKPVGPRAEPVHQYGTRGNGRPPTWSTIMWDFSPRWVFPSHRFALTCRSMNRSSR